MNRLALFTFVLVTALTVSATSYYRPVPNAPFGGYISASGNNISSTNTNGNINLIPNGTGKVGIGTATPSSRLTVSGQVSTLAPDSTSLLHVTGADATATSIEVDAYGAVPSLIFRRSNGTIQAPTALTSAATIGGIFGRGYGATEYSSTTRGAITFITSESWTDSAQGVDIRFQTVAAGGTTNSTKGAFNGDAFVVGSTTATTSAIMEATSTSKGFLPPRMTSTQRDNIASPAAGLIIYNTTTSKHQGYNGATWNDFF
jgi:hypothetical protein